VKNQLGASLKNIRQQQHLSQKDVARNICAQSMLSAIENGKYVPNAKLLINLCERLSISLNDISLLNDFEISNNQKLNQNLTVLCNSHEYSKLKTFLTNTETIKQIQTSEQIQAYYYYLAVANLHVSSNLTAAEQNLKLSISSSEETRVTSSLKRLGLVSLSLIKAKEGRITESDNLLKKATQSIQNAVYEENLNIVFYLAALIKYETNSTENSLKWLEKGISYITEHDSHYMLANCYHLLATIAKNSGKKDLQLQAQRRSSFLRELFGEKINENL
jgi:transcriptional regulator with XRE-family HTH domain